MITISFKINYAFLHASFDHFKRRLVKPGNCALYLRGTGLYLYFYYMLLHIKWLDRILFYLGILDTHCFLGTFFYGLVPYNGARSYIERRYIRATCVHRCGTGVSMRACHAAGPGSIPGRDKFPGWGFFGAFSHL